MTPPLPALLIIDMQQAMAMPQAGERNNPQAEAHIAQLLAAWRAAGQTVIHVRHMSRTPGSLFWPGQSGAAFQPAFQPRGSETVFEKNVPDAFTHSALERWLHVRGIRRLLLVGVSTNNSVESTARSAGNLGFDTLVVSDATFAFAKADYHGTPRSADEVHAMALANLDGEYARVLSTDEALALLVAD